MPCLLTSVYPVKRRLKHCHQCLNHLGKVVKTLTTFSCSNGLWLMAYGLTNFTVQFIAGLPPPVLWWFIIPLILSLCCHENIPWIYSVTINERTPIMSFHGIRRGACTLHKLLHTQKSGLYPWIAVYPLSKYPAWIDFSMHSKNILHNIKCDNVAIESCHVRLILR